jgi:hypothetical protein
MTTRWRSHELKVKSATMRLTLLILVAFLVGCGDMSTTTKSGRGKPTVEPDTRPAFILDASKPFVIELGRGSGMDGLDIIKVDHTGAVELSRIAAGQNVESASLQLSSADVDTLVGLVNANQMTSMGRTYSIPSLADGTQWVLWIEQSGSEKAIYFNNSFPNQITAYANSLDALLQKAGLNKVKWSPVPQQSGIDQQAALWARIEPAR